MALLEVAVAATHQHTRMLNRLALSGVTFAAMACTGSAKQVPEFVALTSARNGFHPVFHISVIPSDLAARITRTTWHRGCPVPVQELRALAVSYWDFQARPQVGVLVVNQGVAKELRGIFRKLYRHGFLIEHIEPIEDFGGNDINSMEANNTSAFNCRDVTLHPGKFSNHSWGRAIDINPLTNPYSKQAVVLPAAGRAFLDRDRTYLGGIRDNSYIVHLFEKKGWTWGGNWTDRHDYQHFEKPVH